MRGKKIIVFLKVATNVVASRPPKRWPTGTPTAHANNFISTKIWQNKACWDKFPEIFLTKYKMKNWVFGFGYNSLLKSTCGWCGTCICLRCIWFLVGCPECIQIITTRDTWLWNIVGENYKYLLFIFSHSHLPAPPSPTNCSLSTHQEEAGETSRHGLRGMTGIQGGKNNGRGYGMIPATFVLTFNMLI